MKKPNRRVSKKPQKVRKAKPGSGARTSASAKERLSSAQPDSPQPADGRVADLLPHMQELGGLVVNLPENANVFSQGDTCDAVYYIEEGRIKVGVVSEQGKEAIIAVVGTGDFVGEDCIANSHPTRLITARTLTDCRLRKFAKHDMTAALRQDRVFSGAFVSFLLTRNLRTQADLIDQLFNSSEKRLARVLLLLSQFGKEGKPETVVPNLSQETLAEMIGTTRSRVSFFMNRFRKLGFIDYNGEIKVNSSLLSVVLHD